MADFLPTSMLRSTIVSDLDEAGCGLGAPSASAKAGLSAGASPPGPHPRKVRSGTRDDPSYGSTRSERTDDAGLARAMSTAEEDLRAREAGRVRLPFAAAVPSENVQPLDYGLRRPG